ncbi:MAG: hypothetical protein JWR32_1121 [Mycobacterium sp.]|jgi:uncharacterized repeat protein (TIGR04042 family)|nr:hypothetical protein [Mycobacterium sp.]
MPEMTFTVRWAAAGERTYYSPSLVVHDYLGEAMAYPVPEFVRRATEALHIASSRVRQKYGFGCTSAAESVRRIHADAAGEVGDVVLVSMTGAQFVSRKS